MKEPISVAILAGGGSRRMGQDKATLSFLGEPLIMRVVNAAREWSDTQLLVGGDAQSLSCLGLPVVPDHFPGVGALGGLHTALSESKNTSCLVIACDLPLLPPLLLKRLVNIHGADVVVPRTPESLQPLCAVYRKSCLASIERLINQGIRRIVDFYPFVDVHELTIAPGSALDPWGNAFMNVNTMDDLDKAINFAKKEISS